MGLIAESDRDYIRRLFAEQLVDDVDIHYFTQHESPLIIPAQECEYCGVTRELLEEVASLSEKLRLHIYDFVKDDQQVKEMGIEEIPAIVLERPGRRGVRFYGIPSGYEFSTLIADIVDVSRGKTDLSQATRDFLSAVTEEILIRVFVTPT
jgi:glutaredoxin-like protein